MTLEQFLELMTVLKSIETGLGWILFMIVTHTVLTFIQGLLNGRGD